MHNHLAFRGVAAGILLLGLLANTPAQAQQTGPGIRPLASAVSARNREAHRRWQQASVYIDGQLRDTTAAEALQASNISHIQLLRPDAAATLGPVAANHGAILITTREHQADPVVVDFNRHVAELQRQATARAGQWHETLTATPSRDLSQRYFLDGRPLPDSELQHLDPQSIDRIEVLNKPAASRYARDSSVTKVLLLYSKPSQTRKPAAN